MTRQLPAGKCLRHAIASVRNNLAYAFRISWPWYLILALLGGVTVFVGYHLSENAQMGFFILAFLVLIIVATVAFAAIAVSWHRYILLDETVRGSGALRLDDKTWRYFGNLLLILLTMSAISGLFSLVIRGVVGTSEIGELVESVLSLAVTCIIGVISYRLSVKLPAVALDRRDFRFSHAWQATHGNDMPLFLVFLVQFVVSLVIIFALFALALANPIVGLVSLVIYVVFIWLLSIFNITILTSLYGFFVENRDF